MGDFSFQDIANSIGGLLIICFLVWQAIEKFFGNVGFIKEKRIKREKEEKEKLKNLYQEFTEEFVKEFMPTILDKLNEHNEAQDDKLEKLIKSSNDILRKEIVRIYYKYLPYKKILQYDKEALIRLYTDYHNQGGNTFIDDIWAQMCTWEVVSCEAQLKGEE